MRIVFVSMFSGHVNRGAEAWNALMAAGMARRGHRVTLVQGGPVPAASPGYAVISTQFAAVDRSGYAARTRVGRLAQAVLSRCYLDRTYRDEALFGLKAMRIIAGLQPDVVVSAGGIWPFLLYVCYRSFGAKPGFKVIAVDHSGMRNQFRDYARLGVDGIVVYRPFYVEDGPVGTTCRTVVRLIPSPIDEDLFRNDGTRRTFSLEPPIILTTAALVPYKGVDRVVRAVSALECGSVLVVGDGPLRSEIEALGSRLLGPRRFLRLSSVPHEEMASIYRSADVYCLASGSGEYFGLAVVEALACGCRLVLHDDEVRRWTAGDSAVYTNTADVEALTEAVRAALATASPPRQAQLSRFSVTHSAAALEELITTSCR